MQKKTTTCLRTVKTTYNMGTKPRSYASGEKVWLNSKYIKTKYNQKLEAKFFGSLLALYGNQA